MTSSVARPAAIDERVAGHRACLVDRPRGRHALHQFAASAVRPDGQSPADDLAKRGQVGPDADTAPAPPRDRRGSPVMTSSKMSSAPSAEHRSRSPSRKPGRGATTPMLPTTGSTMSAAIRPGCAVKARAHAREIVEAGGHGVARRRVRHAGAVRCAECGSTRSRLDEKTVAVPVIAPLELDDPGTSGDAARHAVRQPSSPRCPSSPCGPSRSTAPASSSRSAMSTSSAVGAPNAVPSCACRVMAATTAGCACPRIIGPHEPMKSIARAHPHPTRVRRPPRAMNRGAPAHGVGRRARAS